MNWPPLFIDGDRVGAVVAFLGLPRVSVRGQSAMEFCEMLVRLAMTTAKAIQYLSAAAHVRLDNMFEAFYSTYVYVDRDSVPVVLPESLLAS